MKSTTLIEQFLKDRTLLFVSHSERQVEQICDRVLVILNGKIHFDGPTEEGLSKYRETLKMKKDPHKIHRNIVVRQPHKLQVQPLVRVERCEFLGTRIDKNGLPKFVSHERCKLRLSIVVRDATHSSLRLTLRVKSASDVGVVVGTICQVQVTIPEAELKPLTSLTLSFELSQYASGRYWLEIESELPETSGRVAGEAIEVGFSVNWWPLTEPSKYLIEDSGILVSNLAVDEIREARPEEIPVKT